MRGEAAVGRDDDPEGEDAGDEEREAVEVGPAGDRVVGRRRPEDEEQPDGQGEGEERGLGVAPEGPLLEPGLAEHDARRGSRRHQPEVAGLERRRLDRQVGQLAELADERLEGGRGRVGLHGHPVTVGVGVGDRRGRTGDARRARGWCRRPGCARREDRDAVGQPLGLVEVVGGEQDRLAERGQVRDGVPAAPPGLRVEPGGGLVEEDDVRVTGEREREVEAPALPAGEPADELATRASVELDELEQLLGRSGPPVVGAPARRPARPPGGGSGTRTPAARCRCARGARPGGPRGRSRAPRPRPASASR